MKKIADAQIYQDALKLARGFRDQAKIFVESGQKVIPMAFLLSLENGKFNVGVLPLHTLPSKNSVKPIVQELIRSTNAVAVITIQDTYMNVDTDPEAKRQLEAGELHVKDLPTSYEALFTQLEIRDGLSHHIQDQYSKQPDGSIVWKPSVESYTDEDTGPTWSGRMTGYFK